MCLQRDPAVSEGSFYSDFNQSESVSQESFVVVVVQSETQGRQSV